MGEIRVVDSFSKWQAIVTLMLAVGAIVVTFWSPSTFLWKLMVVFLFVVAGIATVWLQEQKEMRDKVRADAAEKNLLNWQRGDPDNPPRINFFRTLKAEEAGETELKFYVENPSQFTHYDISLRLWDVANIPDPPTDLEDIMNRSMVKEMPAISPSTVQIFGTLRLASSDTTKHFGAQLICRAGAYSEGIKGVKVNSKWTFARRMTTFDKEGKVMFEKIDDDYPRNPDGGIDW